jgi:hypothetical protein
MSFGTNGKKRVCQLLLAICCVQSMVYIPSCCSAFHQLWTRPRLYGVYSTASDSAERSIQSIHDIIEIDSLPSVEDQDSGIELWLDIRGTSLTPKTALELWNLEENLNNLPQKGVDDNSAMERLPKLPFHKCLVSSEDKFDASLPQKYDNQSLDVLFVSESTDDNQMPYIFQPMDPSETSPTQSIGRLLPLQASSNNKPLLPDPLPAMKVVSSGQWIILDTEGWKKVAEEERLRMVLPLLELLSPGVSSYDVGGIGMTCHTNNEIVRAVMFIQCMTSGGGSDGRNVRTTTLESGIVVPQHHEMNISSTTPSGAKWMRRFAIVVPCDLGLVQTAKLMLSNNNEFDSISIA